MSSKNKHFTVIVRDSRKVKSRQWFYKHLLRIRRLLLNYLPKSNKSLVKSSSLSVLITNNKEIQSLNKTFRKKNKPTDVLSFHLKRSEQVKQKYLGDVAISHMYAKKSAKSKNIPLDKELQTLLIHAYLHLLGYDHILPKDARSMLKLQNKILYKLN